MKIPRLIVTREHGSWAVVFVPMIVAAGLAGSYSVSELLVFCAALTSFMMYVPLQSILRSSISGRPADERVRDSRLWVLILGIIALTSGFGLVILGLPLIVWFALTASVFFFGNFLLVRYFQKSIVSDLVAVAGLTVGAPAVYYAATRRVDEMAFLLWILNLLFFGSSVFYVHMKMKASSLRRDDLSAHEKLSIGKLNILYHFLTLIVVAALASINSTSELVILAFVPMTIHAVIGTIKLTSNVRYKALGFALLGQSVFFCFLIVLLGRPAG